MKGQVGAARALITNQAETHLRNAQEELREEHVEIAIYTRIEVLATEVGEDAWQLGVRDAAEHVREDIVPVRWRAFDEARPGIDTRASDQDLVFLVGHLVDAVAQSRSAAPSKARLQPTPVFRKQMSPGRSIHAKNALHEGCMFLAVRVPALGAIVDRLILVSTQSG